MHTPRSALLCVIALGSVHALEPIIIPRVEDPSPVVDGDVGEWSDRGVLRALDGPEHVTYRPTSWHGARDLSGWVRMGHDRKQLYLACHVVDDVVSQTETGTSAWRGDHVIVLLDFVRSGEWQSIVQLGLSPGNLGSGDGDGLVTRPELVVWRPEGVVPEGAAVAAKRTAGGYDLEAAVPWHVLGVLPVPNQVLALDVAFSDSDQLPSAQKSCMSVSTAPWSTRDPTRLILAGLADRSGSLPADAFTQRRVPVVDALTIGPKEEKTFTVDVGKTTPGLVPVLTFQARTIYPKAAGCIGGLYVRVNGKALEEEHLAERPRAMEFVSGGQSPAWSRGIVLYYSPDFEAVETSSYKPVGFRACDYVLRLDGLIREGPNTLTFANGLHHSLAAKPLSIAMANVVLTWWTPSRFKPPKVFRPAPTGPLPVFEPSAEHRVAQTATVLAGGAVQVAWAGRSLTVVSRFSKPQGAWAELGPEAADGWDSTGTSGENLVVQSDGLRLTRSLQTFDECVLVRDTLNNTGPNVRPLRVVHRAAAADHEAVWLSGRPVRGGTGVRSVPENPSAVVLDGRSGFGLMAHDDVFRIHCQSSCDGKQAALADNSLALRPGVTYSHEWLIVPLLKPDYWAFVNAMRRYFDTNFTIPGSFAFFPAPHEKHLSASLTELSEFVDRKSARFLGITTGHEYKGIFAHGPTRRDCDPEVEGRTIRMLRELRPGVSLLPYFNCFDCGRAKGDPLRWPECQVLRPDGKNIREGTTYPVYCPTLDNAYGRETDLTVAWILGTIGGDGLYWDMFNGYGYHYGEPWDGWSVDIDPGTHTVTRRKSSTALLSWNWRRKVIEQQLAEGRPLVANGAPMTTSEYRYRFPRFVETADITRLSQTHLFTPIALGDHVSTRHEADAYQHMLKALDWGGLFYWYSSRVVPTRTTLTACMFPFTPIELHAGYVIGKERILTNRSGRFGWGDLAELDAFVFDRVGRQTDTIAVPRVVAEGKAYAEVRIPEGYAAAIVHR